MPIRNPIQIIEKIKFKLWLRKYRRASEALYQKWIVASERTQKQEVVKLLDFTTASKYQPLISIVMPVYNVEEKWLRAAIESLLLQSYKNWELCIADDNSSATHIKPVLNEYSAQDSRIKIVFRRNNGHISAASNSALEIATGDYVALLDNDDELAPNALLYVAAEILNDENAGLIYSDEDKIDENNRRFDPAFKPDWSSDLFYSLNYINHLSVFRRDILTKIGGFDESVNGSQDYDLILRFIEQIDESQIKHIPRILYHWRAIQSSVALDSNSKTYAHEAARNALRGHFKRKGISAEITQGFENYHKINYELPNPAPKVSIIIETDKLDAALENNLNFLINKTVYESYEIVIGSNLPTFESLENKIETIDAQNKIKIFPLKDNSRATRLNELASKTGGEILIFLEAGTIPLNENWLHELVSQTQRNEIGAVSGKILCRDETVRFAGYVLGINDVCGRAHHRFPRDAWGNFARLQVVSNFSAVSIECLAVKREDFNALNGFDEKKLPEHLFDVDFCLRLQAKGKLNLLTPYAELKLISDFKEKKISESEKKVFLEHWRELIENDSFYNSNLTRRNESFQVELPPRS